MKSHAWPLHLSVIRSLVLAAGLTQNGSSSGSNSWTDYLGADDGSEKSSIIIRFPDGRKDKKDIPCTSKFLVSGF